MAQIKISELTALSEIEDTDVLAGVDTSNASTVKIPAIYLKQYVNKEQDKTLTELATNIETNTENIETNTENIETNTENISENNASIKSNTSRIKRMESNLYDSGVENGSSISIKDSTLAEFQEVTIDGVCEQVTTNGNQLLDFSTQPSDSKTTHTFENDVLTINADGSTPYQSFYKRVTDLVKNNPGKKIGFDFESFTFENNHSAAWVQLVVNYNDGTATSYHTLLTNGLVNTTYTIPDDTSNIKSVDLPIYATTSPAMANTIKIVKPLLYFDDNDTYEPYTGGQASPSPDYPQSIDVIDEAFELKSCGKNFIKLEPYTLTYAGITTIFDGKKFKISGTATSSWSKVSNAFELHLAPGKYVISKYVSTSFQLIITFYNGTTKVGAFYVGKPTTHKVFELKERVTSATLSMDYISAGDVIDDEIEIQLEKGEVATEYEPYQESKIEIILPDGEFAGKINNAHKDQFQIKWNDEDKNYHLYLEKKVGKTKITTCSDFYTRETNNIAQSNDIAETVLKPASASEITYLKSNYFVDGYSANNVFGKDIMAIASTTTGLLDMGFGLSSKINTKEKAQQFLDDNDVYVYYPLAEPYELDLGSVDMLLSYYPVTNVFTDSELNPNINAKYYREFVATIRNLQVNNGTLQSELADVQTRLSALETSLNNLLVSQVESEVVE